MRTTLRSGESPRAFRFRRFHVSQDDAARVRTPAVNDREWVTASEKGASPSRRFRRMPTKAIKHTHQSGRRTIGGKIVIGARRQLPAHFGDIEVEPEKVDPPPATSHGSRRLPSGHPRREGKSHPRMHCRRDAIPGHRGSVPNRIRAVRRLTCDISAQRGKIRRRMLRKCRLGNASRRARGPLLPARSRGCRGDGFAVFPTF